MRVHTIGRLRLHLSSSARLAPSLPELCSRWFHQRLRDALGSLLEHLDNGSDVCIDRLELDLGSFAAENWEEQLQQRLLDALQTALKERLGASGLTPRKTDASTLSSPASVFFGHALTDFSSLAASDTDDIDESTMPSLISGMRQPELIAPSLAMLRRYLLSGYAEPVLRDFFRAGKATLWLQQQCMQAPDVAASLLHECRLKESARRRLQQAFPAIENMLHESAGGLGNHPLQDKSPTLRFAGYRVLKDLPHSIWRNRSGLSGPTPAMLQRYLLNGDAEPALRQLFHAGQAISWLRAQLRSGSQAWHTVLHQCAHDPIAAGRLQRTFGGVGLKPAKERFNAATAVQPLPPALATERYQVDNAGLILLWPLLPGLFRRWGLLDQGRFIDANAQQLAICRLDTWLWQSLQPAEWRMALTKVLCGGTVEQALALSDQSDQDAGRPAAGQDLDALLRDLAAQTPGLQRCDHQDIRRWFLQRPGALCFENQRWHLQVEPDASDLLLGDLPWPVSQVALPWLEVSVEVVWL